MGLVDLFYKQSPSPNAALAESVLALARLERKIDRLIEAIGVSQPDIPDHALPHDVWELVAQGRTISAIKRYRDISGAGLKEAKEAVESGMSASVDLASSLERKMDLILKSLSIKEVDAPNSSPDSDRLAGAWMSEVEALIRQNKMIAAVSLHREKTGQGLRESKDWVDSIRRKIDAEQHR